jgi:hypothetical protein
MPLLVSKKYKILNIYFSLKTGRRTGKYGIKRFLFLISKCRFQKRALTKKYTVKEFRTNDFSLKTEQRPHILYFIHSIFKRFFLLSPWQVKPIMEYFVLPNWSISNVRGSKKSQRSGDIITCATRMFQFSSEMQQTWHTYYPRPQRQLWLKMFFYKFRSWTAHNR